MTIKEAAAHKNCSFLMGAPRDIQKTLGSVCFLKFEAQLP
jgi:hypothetical protein